MSKFIWWLVLGTALIFSNGKLLHAIRYPYETKDLKELVNRIANI